jgi:hypothetical protein
LSIGGWGGSQYFSSAVATKANRTAFAQTIMKTVKKYNLGGIEIEYACLQSFFESRPLIVIIAGSSRVNKGLAATSYRRMTPPISFPS